jgi:hypothetical protein
MISIKVVLRKKKLSSGKYPIYLRITKERKSIFFRTPYISEEKEWDNKQGKFSKYASDYLNKNRLLYKSQDIATDIISQLEQGKDYCVIEDIEKALQIETNSHTNKIYPFYEEIGR